MATPSLSAINKRLNQHSKKIAVIEQQQQEQHKLLTSIDKKLSPEYFEQVKMLYEYVIVGNGQPSLKSWRNEIDKERQGGVKWGDRLWQILQAIILIIAGGVISRYIQW